MNRRRFLAGAGGLILSSATSRLLAEPANPSTACYTTRQVTPGPFVLPESPQRSDIRGGLPGMPLALELRIIDDIWCEPVAGAVVDIWQCDALGRYSGVENLAFDRDSLRITGTTLDLRGEDFLRGHQVSGEDGVVRFTTLVPGWYVPRLPHIHVKVQWRNVGWTALSTQLFFPGEIERAVYATEPYAGRGPNPIDSRRDIVIKGQQERLDALTLDLQKDGEGLAASFEIATAALGPPPA